LPTNTVLDERRARYERIVAMRDQNMTLEAIGASFDPPLSKQRVLQILAKAPRRVGRPHSADRRETLRALLRFWEARRAARAKVGADTVYSDDRVRVLSERIAALETD
jgi:hypothetical protein